MKPTRHDIPIRQGATKRFRFHLAAAECAPAQDLTGASARVVAFKRRADADPLIELAVDAGITIDIDNFVLVEFSPDRTADLPIGSWPYFAELTRGDRVDIVLVGCLVVTEAGR